MDQENRALVETYSNRRSLVLVVLLLFLITLRPRAGRVRRRRSDNATQHATPESLLLLRLVSSFHSDHRPEDLEQTEADEEQRAAGQSELRKRTGLALRPARGDIKYASLHLRRDGPCESSMASRARPRRRRGGDRRLIAALLSLVAFLAEEGGFIFFYGPPRRATPRHALLCCCQCAERPQQSGTYLRGAHWCRASLRQ